MRRAKVKYNVARWLRCYLTSEHRQNSGRPCPCLPSNAFFPHYTKRVRVWTRIHFWILINEVFPIYNLYSLRCSTNLMFPLVRYLTWIGQFVVDTIDHMINLICQKLQTHLTRALYSCDSERHWFCRMPPKLLRRLKHIHVILQHWQIKGPVVALALLSLTTFLSTLFTKVFPKESYTFEWTKKWIVPHS